VKPKPKPPALRHVRCPRCKLVWQAPRSEAAEVGRAVSTFDWPAKVCADCLAAAARTGLQACLDAGEGIAP
jgi:hypothetical protein